MSFLLKLFIAYIMLSLNCVEADAPFDLDKQSLEELTQTHIATPPQNISISTASLYAQNSSQSPSALRIVTADDIKTYGYRTLAEVLRSLPGIYVTQDRNYTYLGVRGFGRPSDYNARVLLMLDGVRINDNIYDGAYIGNEFMLDVDLIDRVEFIPGSGSALYGNNAFFGVINIITKHGHDLDGGQISAEYGGFETYKVRGSYGKRFDNGLEAILSATGFDREGPNHLYFPAYDTPSQNQGKANGLDYDRYHSAFAKFSWQGFNLEASYIDRLKGIPTASFEQVFNDPQSHTQDRQFFTALTYNQQISQYWNAYLRLDYHKYDYNGDYIYSSPLPRTVNRDLSTGEWLGGEIRFTNTWLEHHKMIFGLELQSNFQQFQKNYVLGGSTILDKNYSSIRYGAYFQDEYAILDSLSLLAGARYDYNPLGGGSINPRIGIIWRALEASTLKLIYGTAFRAPNTFESFYTDGSSVIPTGQRLLPERIRSLEFIIEHFFTPSTRFSTSLYRYHIEQLITQTPNFFGNFGFTSYQNQDSVHAIGMELEGEQRYQNGMRVRLSYVLQQSRSKNTGTLSNSPSHQLKLNISMPLWTEKWRMGFETQYISQRYALNNKVDDYVLGNLNINADISYNLSLGFGIYNIFNSHYADPVGTEVKNGNVVQDGRSFRLKLNMRF
jgi:iron complex outermembrane receptor protein